MEQIVRVRTVHADGTADVIHVRQSACSGDCHKCSGCGAAQETILLSAKNPVGAQPGDLVVVASETGPVLRAAAVLYGLPLVLFFAGYAAGAALWRAGGITACAAFALGIALAVVYDRHAQKKEETGYTITGFAEDTLLRSVKKGDNDFD